MELLINKAKVATVLQVAIGIHESEFLKYIEDAQKFSLKDLMCESFFYALIEHRTEAKYKRLIDGDIYTFENREYRFEGIGEVLAYFTYAEFIMNSNVVSTSHNFVQKKTPYSEPITLEERRNYYYRYKARAGKLFEGVRRFIERNIEKYPLWRCDTGTCETKNINESIITDIIQ